MQIRLKGPSENCLTPENEIQVKQRYKMKMNSDLEDFMPQKVKPLGNTYGTTVVKSTRF